MATVRVSEKTGKKYYYDPEGARARRQRIMDAARAGGYVPQRRVGTGATIKKTSAKTGKEYYYTPWENMSPERKQKAIDYSKDYGRKIRADARAFREEHSQPKARRKRGEA